MQANMGGVGGGGMVLPISMIFFKFDAKNAIALSNFSIFLSSGVRYFINANKPHPLKNGKGLLVDLNLALLMLPLIISGVSIGVVLNLLMPNIILIGFFIAILVYMGYGVLLKGIALYNKEVKRDMEIARMEALKAFISDRIR